MAQSNDMKALDLLFQRPLDPVFTSRDNGKASFDLPDSYFTERYKGVSVELQSRFGDDVDLKIPLRETSGVDLSFAQGLGKRTQFSLFNDKHKQIAGQLIQLFLDAADVSQFAALAAYVKDRLNPYLFQYAYSVAVQHRPDTANVQVPPIVEQFPTNFVEPSVFQDARAEGTLISNPGNRIHLQIPRNYTASDREPEQRMAYFREDIGVNMHHWHWHLVYPTEGPMSVVNKDRRGELFYYMHHQIIARYNVERFCNQLPKAKPFSNLREPIPEGYYPKIISSVNNRTYPGRNANMVLKNVERTDNNIEVVDVERWADRIHQAIDQGFVTNYQGQNIPLDEVRGIDYLGNIIEASSLSPNRQLYGNLHNMGHNMISFSHDPDFRHLEDFGVMGDVTTAMRDPIFYRWHGNIDNIFNKHKSLLPRYEAEQLGFNGVSIDKVETKITSKGAKPNVLLTFWQKTDVDLAAGLDFGPNGNIYAHFTHLQHAPFDYSISATNNNQVGRQGTCRIFICPKTDEQGTLLTLDEQRLLAIELDKFTVTLQPGANIIKRHSSQSSVTIPHERSFRRIGAEFQPTDSEELAKFRFCGCGWPDHLLIPKGTEQGMEYDLFVMISDYSGDAVQQNNTGPDICGDSSSFCGLKDKLYPDKRSMGFPFDRRITGTSMEEWSNSLSNMKVQKVSIKFTNRVLDRM